MSRKIFAVRRGRGAKQLEQILADGVAAGWEFIGATEGGRGETTLFFEGEQGDSRPFGPGMRTKQEETA